MLSKIVYTNNVIYDGAFNHLVPALMAQTEKNLPAMQQSWVQSLDWEDPLGKGMVTHSSILAWRIPWTEEPDRLQSMECKELDITKRLSLSLFHNLQRDGRLKVSHMDSHPCYVTSPQ
ncbi:unnamed protein product [Rangifer tarandus platyrhynchus]|uniref:Uncharacterized protein n=2 Tax=Rangifer tarandus platyrhynchus TaxID=3082113 RepID=A0AC59Z224_RANTA|nr:unnamed protein product [Rangifer tarandus platyrhynchus]